MDIRKHRCSCCSKETSQGAYTLENKFLCADCFLIEEKWHFDFFEQDGDSIKTIIPLSHLSETDQRAAFIDFAYTIFGNKLSPAAYRLITKYRKEGKTFIGMLRAMEWFYLIKKNPTTKAKNNIAIIPYVYNEAQTYYVIESTKRYNRFKKAIEYAKKEKVEIIYEKEDLKREDQLTMKDL